MGRHGWIAVVGLAGLTGCHSAYVEATVRNQTTQTISPVEMDYPSASFGTQVLAPGAEYHYRFKVLGSGGTKLLWTDVRHQDQHNDGPALAEGDEGTLIVTLGPGGVTWEPKLAKH